MVAIMWVTILIRRVSMRVSSRGIVGGKGVWILVDGGDDAIYLVYERFVGLLSLVYVWVLRCEECRECRWGRMSTLTFLERNRLINNKILPVTKSEDYV